MTDREMLELAAKAAGIEVRILDYGGGRFEGQRRVQPDVWTSWNPHTHDGDALRLAVKLGINIHHEDPDAVLCGWTQLQRTPITLDGKGPWFWKEWLRDHQKSRIAATRCAITSAAAEVGRSMK